MRIELPKGAHLPVLKLNDRVFPLWEYLRVRAIEKAIKRSGLQLDWCGVGAFDELSKIGKYYLPPFSLNGLTVLDVGACCGETAWFFLKHGAGRVVAVECNKQRVRLIEENRRNLGLNIDIVPEKFKPEHLLFPHDFIKCDIEGYEMELLPYAKTLKPCVVEVHTDWIKEQFEKNGFHTVTSLEYCGKFHSNVCLMTNYRKAE